MWSAIVGSPLRFEISGLRADMRLRVANSENRELGIRARGPWSPVESSDWYDRNRNRTWVAREATPDQESGTRNCQLVQSLTGGGNLRRFFLCPVANVVVGPSRLMFT